VYKSTINHLINSHLIFLPAKNITSNEYLIHKIKAGKSAEPEHPSESLQESREKIERQEEENKQSFKRKR